LAEIESDLVSQLLKAYRGGMRYDEFWELVDKLRSFSKLRKNFGG